MQPSTDPAVLLVALAAVRRRVDLHLVTSSWSGHWTQAIRQNCCAELRQTRVRSERPLLRTELRPSAAPSRWAAIMLFS